MRTAGFRVTDATTVEAWAALFLDPATSPRGQRLAAKGRPYSPNTLFGYQSLYNYLKGDPDFSSLPVRDVTVDHVLAHLGRMAKSKIARPKGKKRGGDQAGPKGSDGGGKEMSGSRTYVAYFSFLRMTFREYALRHPGYTDPWVTIERPQDTKGKRGALTEAEFLTLFSTDGFFADPLEEAVVTAVFWSGLRRSEILALKQDSLDLATRTIHVTRAWKRLDSAHRTLGDPKFHKPRDVPYPQRLEDALVRLWEVYGRHEFVFADETGKTPTATWWARHLGEVYKRLGIDAKARRITPHSARHTFASVLYENGTPIRAIQEILGHSDLKVTDLYLHKPVDAMEKLASKIDAIKFDKERE